MFPEETPTDRQSIDVGAMQRLDTKDIVGSSAGIVKSGKFS